MSTEEDDSLEIQDNSRLTKDEIEERRQKVHQLMVRGLSQKRIAEIVEVSAATITRDIAVIKKNVTKYKNFNREEFIADTITGYDDIWSECWKIASETNDKELKLKAMTAARLALNDKRKALQETGVVKKEMVGNNNQIHVNLIGGLTPEQIEKAALSFLNSGMKTQLQMPEPDVIDVDEESEDEDESTEEI